MRRPSRFQNVLLTVGAVLGSLCLMAALAGVFFGVKPLMFKSGSMEPTISTGGLALSIPVDGNEIRIGDIVSTENSTGTRITHRVTAVEPADGYASLTLKGDANDVVDAEVYAVAEVDRVFWSVPLLGYVVAWFSSPVALFLGGLFTAYLLYIAFGPRSSVDFNGEGSAAATRLLSGRRARRPGRRRKGHSLRGAIGMTVVGTLVLTGGALSTGGPARAQFSDVAIAASTFGAGKLSTPGNPACTVRQSLVGLADQIELSWSYGGVVPAVGYEVSVDAGAPTYTTNSSTNLAAIDASVSIIARHGKWKSAQPLNVWVDYTWGALGSRVTCRVI